MSKKHTNKFYALHTAIGPAAAGRVELGASGLQVSRIGIGLLQWGDPGSGFGKAYDEARRQNFGPCLLRTRFMKAYHYEQAQLSEVYSTLTEGGQISFFDTAEVCGTYYHPISQEIA